MVTNDSRINLSLSMHYDILSSLSFVTKLYLWQPTFSSSLVGTFSSRNSSPSFSSASDTHSVIK